MAHSILTFAKLNLNLKVYPALQTGYHPIVSTFVSISLHDELFIRILKEKKMVLRKQKGSIDFPLDESNLLFKVYQSFFDDIPFGLDIAIKKNIPIGGGLGGASSNAAGLIHFLNQICSWGLSIPHLIEKSIVLGSDIPFFFYGGRALVEGVGEKVTPLSYQDAWHLLVLPPFSCETKEIFQLFDKIEKKENTPYLRYQDNNLLAVVSKKNPEIDIYAQNVFHAIKKPLSLSGSGSTLFIAYQNLKEAKADYEKITPLLPDCVLHIVRSEKTAWEHLDKK